MNRTMLPFVLIFLGLQFHGVSAGALGVLRWSNRLNPSTGTLALEAQGQTPEGNPSEFVASAKNLGVLRWSNQLNPSTGTLALEAQGQTPEGNPSEFVASAKNHRELYWGIDSRWKPLLIREENPPDEPPALIKHNIISCEEDDCEEDFQNDRGSGHKDCVFDDSGDLEETTSDAESDHFSENYSQERGTWSPDGATETPGEQNAEEENDLSEISEFSNGESDEETYHENDDTRDNERATESLDGESDAETEEPAQAGNRQEVGSSAEETNRQIRDSVNDGPGGDTLISTDIKESDASPKQLDEGDQQEGESLPADANNQNHDPGNDEHTVEAGNDTANSPDITESEASQEQFNDIYDDFSDIYTFKSTDITESEASQEQFNDIYENFNDL